MSPWILVIMLHYGYGTAITTIEMPSERVCERAALQLKADSDRVDHRATYCVQREHD